MLGRHNITVYADEAERCVGAMRQLLATRDMEFPEQCYWVGAISALQALLSIDMPDDYQKFVAALQLHFTGEQPGELVVLEDEDKE